MILVDTSAWVEYDRATGSAAHVRLRDLVGEGGEIAVTQPVIMEVVAGARSDRQERQLRRLLNRFSLLPFDAISDFDSAARIYWRCRQQGVTPRGMIDCMIAAVAFRNGASILAHDADLSRVAIVLGLKLDVGSLTA